MPKSDLRKQLLARRGALDAPEVVAASRMAQQSLMATQEFVRGTVIALYAPIRNELDTAFVLRHAIACGMTVLLPVVSGAGLIFRRIGSPDSLKRGAFGILEPDESCMEVSPREADVIVVPGIAFDLSGRRIGYGKGFYDRVLHNLEGKGKLIGFCYDFQLLTEIVDEPHDVVMDMIVTEHRVVCPRNPRD